METTITVAVITGFFGLLGIVVAAMRSTKVDSALNATKTIELSVQTQQGIINTLRDELSRQNDSNTRCLTECAQLRDENVQLLDSHESMRQALNATRAVVSEHEQTITRLQREISQLRKQHGQ